VTFFLQKAEEQNFSDRRACWGMEWEEHKNGYLAKTEHGFFFLYEEIENWYVEYEPGADVYGDVESQPLNLRGFATLEEAKNAADEYSKDLDQTSDLELPEEQE
jgi:hypothetical protein